MFQSVFSILIFGLLFFYVIWFSSVVVFAIVLLIFLFLCVRYLYKKTHTKKTLQVTFASYKVIIPLVIFGFFSLIGIYNFVSVMHPTIPVDSLSPFLSANTKRQDDVVVIYNAIESYIGDHHGKVPPEIITTHREIAKGGSDICGELVPKYIPALPVDPSINKGLPITDCNTDYRTGYATDNYYDEFRLPVDEVYVINNNSIMAPIQPTTVP